MLSENAKKEIQVVAINIGPSKKDFTAHLFQYDTLMGIYPGTVAMENDELIVDDHWITLLAEADPAKLPWGTLEIDWVVDCSGCFTHRQDAQKHILAGAKKVLISAPAQDEDITIIPGVNDDAYDASKHAIVSAGQLYHQRVSTHAESAQ